MEKIKIKKILLEKLPVNISFINQFEVCEDDSMGEMFMDAMYEGKKNERYQTTKFYHYGFNKPISKSFNPEKIKGK